MKEKFSFELFTSLMTSSPAKAFAYRESCSNSKEVKEEIKEEVKAKELTNEINPDDFTEDDEEEVKEEKIEFNRDDLIAMLNKADIKFATNSKDETLLKKCLENNLI